MLFSTDFKDRRLRVIVNPIAGHGLGQRFLKFMRGKESSDWPYFFEYSLTQKRLDALRWAAQSRPGDILVAGGGDGTLNEVINGAPEGVLLFPVPLGTSNVYRREMGLPKNPFTCVERFFSQALRIEEVHIGQLRTARGERLFFSMVGVGFDADVVYQTQNKRTSLTPLHVYARAALHRYLGSYQPSPFTIQIHSSSPTGDGRRPVPNSWTPRLLDLPTSGLPDFWTSRRPAANSLSSVGFAIIAKAHSYGGPFEFVPTAHVRKACLDGLYFDHLSKTGLIRVFLAGLFHQKSLFRCGRLVCAQEYTLTPLREEDRAIPIHIDGEPAGFLPCAVWLAERRFRFLLPASLPGP